MIKMLFFLFVMGFFFLLAMVAFIVDCFLTVITFTTYLWFVQTEKMLTYRAIKYYIIKTL